MLFHRQCVAAFALGTAFGLAVSSGGDARQLPAAGDWENGSKYFQNVEKVADVLWGGDRRLQGEVRQPSVPGYFYVRNKGAWNAGGVGHCSLKAQVARQPDGIKREYLSVARLSEDDEEVVIQLAKKRGFKKIAKLATNRIEPTPYFEIRVFGEDEINGRDVSFESLSVTSKKWSFPEARPAREDIRLGDFWAGIPLKVRQKILKVKGSEYRVNVIQDVTLEECELILGRLLEKRFVVTPNANFGVEEILWSKPLVIRRDEDGVIMASFSHKGTGVGFTEVKLEIVQDRLEVTPFAMAIP